MQDAAQRAPVNPWLIAIVVSLATFMEVLDTTITSVSIRHIAGSLAASPEESTWVLTSYLVANGIILPISGWLSNVLGRKAFFLWCIAGFTVSSLLCGLAGSLFMLIAFRILQGLAGGGLQPTQQAILLDSFPPHKRAAAFAFTGITVIVAPILGPTLGGWITDNYDWRWIFYINVPIGAVAFFLTWKLVQDPPHARAQGLAKVDYIGLFLIVLGLGTMQFILDKGQQEDWFHSNLILLATGVMVFGLVGATVWLLKREDPIVDLHLLKEPGFGVSCFLIFITGFVLYGGSTMLPLLLQTHYGYDSTHAGLVLSPSGILVLVLMPAAVQLMNRVQARYLTMVGLILGAVGMYYTMHITPDTDFTTFVHMRMVQMVGMPLLFIPISTLAFQHIPKEKNNQASALFSVFRNIGGSVGIALTTTYVFRHTQMHQAYLSEHLSPYSPVYRGTVDQMTSAVGDPGLAMGQLYRTLLEQSALLAYIDTFQLLCGLMLVAAVMALLLPKNDPRAGANVAAH